MNLHVLSDAVRRFFDLQPGELVVRGVADTVLLTQDVNTVPGGRVGKIYSRRAQVGATAAQYQSISLLHPAGAVGVDVEILEVHIRNLAGSYILYGLGTSTTYTDLGAGYAHDVRDLTFGYRSNAHLLEEDANVPMLVAQGEIQNATQEWKPIGGLWLQPGQMWTFRTAAQNQGITGMIIWRETVRSQNP